MQNQILFLCLHSCGVKCAYSTELNQTTPVVEVNFTELSQLSQPTRRWMVTIKHLIQKKIKVEKQKKPVPWTIANHSNLTIVWRTCWIQPLTLSYYDSVYSVKLQVNSLFQPQEMRLWLRVLEKELSPWLRPMCDVRIMYITLVMIGKTSPDSLKPERAYFR